MIFNRPLLLIAYYVNWKMLTIRTRDIVGTFPEWTRGRLSWPDKAPL